MAPWILGRPYVFNSHHDYRVVNDESAVLAIGDKGSEQ